MGQKSQWDTRMLDLVKTEYVGPLPLALLHAVPHAVLPFPL